VERRYLVFIVLSLLVFALNFTYLKWAEQKQRQQIAQNPAQAVQADVKKQPGKANDEKPPADKAQENEEAAPDAGKKPDVEEKPDADKKPDAEEKPAEKAGEKDEQPVAVPQQWISLGSLDPASPYRMLATITNQGAALVRVELNSSHYLELDHRYGFLGSLAPADVPQGGGALVQVVGLGTPAQEAGVQVGDIIQAVDDVAVTTAEELIDQLRKTKPKQQVDLSIRRAGAVMKRTATLRRRPLAVIHPNKLDVTQPGKDDQIVDFPQPGIDPLSLLLTMQQIDDGPELGEKQTELKGLAMRTANWEVLQAGESEVSFRMKLPKQELEVLKHFRLAKVPDGTEDLDFPAYHLEFTIEIRNTAAKARTIAYRLDGPTGLPVEGSWYASKIERSSGIGLRDLIAQFEGGDPDEITASVVADGKGEWKGADVPLKYAAVDAQYFSAALIPGKQDVRDKWFTNIVPLRVSPLPNEKSLYKLTDVTFRLLSRRDLKVQPGQAIKHRFELFVGPKKPGLLENYPTAEFDSRSLGNLSGLVYYGWPIWGWVAERMLGILHIFYAVVRNYGIAIVLLTVLVRGCMFPLSRKQALSAQKMQELQPEIKRINEKFKKNPDQKAKAQQELFRKHNYNPLGGCLLMFVQLPIFIGLYRSLMVDVELRQAPLISDAIRWASNLAAPDMLFNWSAWMPDSVSQGVGFFGLGPYFNILPLLTVGLFLWQQKMFMPPPADDQARMQQKMMQYMMIFMALMFYKVAAGLCIYFIASSAWGIAERKILPKSKAPQQGGGVVATSPSPSKAASNGGPGESKKKQRERK